MDKTDQLFIRACKCLDSRKRLRSVYRRFYGRYDKATEDSGILSVLVRIVDDYAPITIHSYLLDKSRYETYFKMTCEPTTDTEINILVMRDILRFLSRDILESLGVTTPLRLRKEK